MESGKPPAKDGYTKLQDGDITVWVPDELPFPDDVVRVDQRGFLWSTYLEALTDELPRGSCTV